MVLLQSFLIIGVFALVFAVFGGVVGVMAVLIAVASLFVLHSPWSV